MVRSAPAGTRWVRHWDLAASKRRGTGASQAATAGVKLGRAPDATFYVGNVVRLQDEGHEVRKTIRSTAAALHKGLGETGLFIVVLALVKPLSPPGDSSGQLICGPIEG